MKQIILFTAFILLILLIIFLPSQENTATIKYVQDGDTVAVSYKGSTEYVRMEGVDAPETDECYGRQATQQLEDLISGTIELQESDEDRGYYGRLIRYIHDDNKDIGAELIKNGHAKASNYDHPRYDTYKLLEGIAKVNNRGLWNDCDKSGLL